MARCNFCFRGQWPAHERVCTTDMRRSFRHGAYSSKAKKRRKQHSPLIVDQELHIGLLQKDIEGIEDMTPRRAVQETIA